MNIDSNNCIYSSIHTWSGQRMFARLRLLSLVWALNTLFLFFFFFFIDYSFSLITFHIFLLHTHLLLLFTHNYLPFLFPLCIFNQKPFFSHNCFLDLILLLLLLIITNFNLVLFLFYFLNLLQITVWLSWKWSENIKNNYEIWYCVWRQSRPRCLNCHRDGDLNGDLCQAGGYWHWPASESACQCDGLLRWVRLEKWRRRG